MELRHYLSLVQRWLWLILLGGVLGAGLAFVYSRLSTPIYQSTIVLLTTQGSTAAQDYYSMLSTQRAGTTYVEAIKSPVVLRQVYNDLGIPWEEKLAQNIVVQIVRDTPLLRVSVLDPDPARAQAIANQIAKVVNDRVSAAQTQRYRIIQDESDRQVAEVRKKIDEVQKALAPLGDSNDSKSASAPEFVRTERARLQMELTTLQAQYTALLQNANNIRLAAMRSTDAISVFSPAEMPDSPVSPRTTVNVALGLAVGVMLAAGIAFLIEYLDDSLKSSEDVSRVLELSTIGNVARFPKGTKNPLVVLDAPRAPYAEAYRNLRTNLQFSLAVDSANALVVSSAEPGEGKTTTMANLAIAMAQMGKRVILVDADLRRPSLHQLFRVPPEPGLTDVFLQHQTVLQVVRETGQPGLHLLTCGKIPPNPAELLASAWMDQLIDALSKQYDMLLFDAPPILPVTDAVLLAAKTKHLLWVVFAGKTRADALRRAREALAQVDAKIVGVVLNRMASGRGYGYYYYYYSKDGTKHKRKVEKPSFVPVLRPSVSGDGDEPVNIPESLPESLPR